jgi:hypothetical protein
VWRWVLIVTAALAAIVAVIVLVVHDERNPPAQTTAAAAPSAKQPACDVSADTVGPWYSSVIAFEHFDSGRTHDFRCALFTGSFTEANQVGATQFSGSYPTPYNLVLRKSDEAFVYGGAYGDYPGAPGSFVSRVDTSDDQQVWRTQLFDAAAHPSDWNYPGVVGVHQNGYVYVVYGTKLSKLDPDSGKVIATADLPYLGDQANAAYNGFNGFSDGMIVTKSVNRQAGCSEQGFSAFTSCPDSSDVPNSLIAVVNPDSMKVVAKVEAKEPIGGRLTTTRFDGIDRLYLPGSTTMFRYNWQNGKLTLDDSWGPIPYLKSGQTTAPAAAVVGKWVALQTNGLPADTPLSIVAMRQSDAKVSSIQPFAADTKSRDKSFLPSMITVDPENSRVYAMDAGVGKAGGFSLDQDTGELAPLWTKSQRTLNFSTLIGPSDKRVFIATDVPVKTIQGLKSYKTEAVVFRAAETGKQLARSGELPKMTSGALVTPGANGRIYYLGLGGQIYRLSVTRSG